MSNIDLDSQFPFGDALGLANFMLTHFVVHQQIQNALLSQFNVQFSIYGLTDGVAESQWLALMRGGKVKSVPDALLNWLALHSTLHQNEYETLAGSPTIGPPDLSQVNFSRPADFYDWMNAHQQMHDYEQQTLGFT